MSGAAAWMALQIIERQRKEREAQAKQPSMYPYPIVLDGKSTVSTGGGIIGRMEPKKP